MKISQMIGSVAIATSMATLAVVASPLTASAATFNFNDIAGGSTVGNFLTPFLSFDVNASGSGTSFTFKFDGAAPTGFISDIHIDDSAVITKKGVGAKSGSLLGINTDISINNTTTPNVSFKGGIGNKQLSQGGTGFDTDYYFGNNTGNGNAKAIQPGESLSILFSKANYNNVFNALTGGTLRVGYHVQGIGSGSDSYISSPTPTPPKPVPVPGFLLGVMAAGALGGTRLLKNKKQVA